jgi:ABC-type multidrug transport system fused ATPase/permease subunit
MKYVLAIAREYKWQLLRIYFYMFIAQMLFLLEPYVLGKMIDSLLRREYFWLYLFLGIAVFENFFIYRRMIYDTKVYTTIYNNMILKYLKRNTGADSSTRIARTEMSTNIVNFLENDAHYYIYAALSLIGTSFFIFAKSPLTGIVVVSCVAPICATVYIFYRKIAQCTQIGNDHYEQKARVLTENIEKKVETFFLRRKRLLIYGSTLQGKNWTSLNTIKSVFLVVAIIVLTHRSTITQGEAVSMYAYINQFLVSLMSIPVGVETFTRMRDVINRIRE